MKESKSQTLDDFFLEKVNKAVDVIMPMFMQKAMEVLLKINEIEKTAHDKIQKISSDMQNEKEKILIQKFSAIVKGDKPKGSKGPKITDENSPSQLHKSKCGKNTRGLLSSSIDSHFKSGEFNSTTTPHEIAMLLIKMHLEYCDREISKLAKQIGAILKRDFEVDNNGKMTLKSTACKINVDKDKKALTKNTKKTTIKNNGKNHLTMVLKEKIDSYPLDTIFTMSNLREFVLARSEYKNALSISSRIGRDLKKSFPNVISIAKGEYIKSSKHKNNLAPQAA